jgi:putative PIN family toxin of toxin-antitoxin system
MNERLRLVIDTNVLVSHLLLPASIPAQAVRIAVRRDLVLVSEEFIRELAAVLFRPKFDRYVSPEDRRTFLLLLGRIAEPVPTPERIAACRDPKDDMILALAASGQAGLLLTGDRDLLDLKNFRSTQIISPAQYLREHQDR